MQYVDTSYGGGSYESATYPNGNGKFPGKVKAIMQSLKSLTMYVKDIFTLPLNVPPANTNDWETRRKRALQETIVYSASIAGNPWLLRGEIITNESLEAMRKSLEGVRFNSPS
jgi:hypothetical protein